ncbi:hypothetical protein CCMSSC00406_0007748 [Pleurotus cornucopiae]|uniref:Uncharacterized protein n=1 Tax=Pleurotus cornucopiae TaxID=5321 RepID=A0ACB7J194_PLECO|nr:hypothetical protein CCMSSC00406_0007748 [Pleurotus cornucopiae]
MHRLQKKRQPDFDLSIHGDELEQGRILLEHTLQHADLSFHLSSTPDTASQGDRESLEYPRHASEPVALRDFASFEQRSRIYFDEEGEHSPIHPWSYRTADDEEGINPYGGETMSTAAHHASNLTLGAGLGGRGYRHDISMSGAEYDPDRPLRDILPAVASHISAFGHETSRSRYPGMGSVDADPVVIDNTAELDRLLQSGHAATPRSARVSSRAPSECPSDTESVTSRPKLSEALRRVSFSPRRPRTVQGNISPSHSVDSNQKHSPMKPSHRPSSRVPPSPFASRQRKSPHTSRTNSQAKMPLINVVGASPGPTRPSPRRPITRDTNNVLNSSRVSERGKMYLPDVTGITNAVESPARPHMSYYRYEGDGKPREVDVYFITALNEVQAKLYRLDEENGISRRRVRELEMELEVCKREVARERTRVLEREEMLVQHKVESERKHAKDKGKQKEQDDLEVVERRYREAVEEKKALESLISTLRSHLTRLTSELADHKQILTELREMREADTRAMQDKGSEIEHLKQEVERLAGEVEVLRGVVEEGLKERRESGRSRILAEGESMHEDGDPPVEQEETHTSCGDDDNDRTSIMGPSRANPLDRTIRTDHATAGTSSLGASASTPFITDEVLQQISMEMEERRSERSRTSVSSSDDSPSQGSLRKSISERHSQIHSGIHSHPPSPSPMGRSGSMLLGLDDDESEPDEPASPPRIRNPDILEARRSTPMPNPRTSTLLEVDDDESEPDEPVSPPRIRNLEVLEARQSTAMPNPRTSTQSSRPAAPTPAHAIRSRTPPTEEETPFPQIRGERMEHLFFSAPVHNAKTCTMCRREGRRVNGHVHEERPTSPLWSIRPRVRERRMDESDEDEGFEEGEEEDPRRRVDANGKTPAAHGQPSAPQRQRPETSRDPLPPQTTLTQVIRELEDDFTHYKSIYVELADQYKDMDPVSNVRKRNMLAQHLHEVVDTMEQKGDQIAKLYSLLTFKDTPATGAQQRRRS